MCKVSMIHIILFALSIELISPFELTSEIWQLCPHDIDTVYIIEQRKNDQNLVDASAQTDFLWNEENASVQYGGYCTGENYGLNLVSSDVLQQLTSQLAESLSDPKCCSFVEETISTANVLRQVKPHHDSNVYLVNTEAQTVSEVYSVGEETIFALVLNRSNPRPIENVSQRRNDLRGIHFKVGILNISPYLIFPPEGTDLNQSRGLCIEILENMSAELNFTYSFSPTSKFGSLGENGAWNGLVGMLQQREVDFVANGIR